MTDLSLSWIVYFYLILFLFRAGFQIIIEEFIEVCEIWLWSKNLELKMILYGSWWFLRTNSMIMTLHNDLMILSFPKCTPNSTKTHLMAPMWATLMQKQTRSHSATWYSLPQRPTPKNHQSSWNSPMDIQTSQSVSHQI